MAAGTGDVARIKRSRIINTSRVLREIWINKEISRIQIAKNLHLDKSTISSIVSELIDSGVISETAVGEAGPLGGRKPVFLRLDNAYGCVLGIELRPESYSAVAVNLDGTIIYSKFELARFAGANFKDAFSDIVQRIRAELARVGPPLLGIGLGVPGVVNPQTGIIRYSIPLQMTDEFDFRREIAGGYDIPLFLENDANACAWGELAFHRVKNLQDFLFLLVEFRDISDRQELFEKTAVGIGIVINGRVHYGHNYSAGEFRSILCSQENRGQFSLERDESFRIEQDERVLRRFIRELSANIAMIVNTLNLDHVFLGGHIERYKREVQSILPEEIQSNWPYPDKVHCAIRFSTLGDRAVAYGAAGMVLHRIFTDAEVSASELRIGPRGVALLTNRAE